ncbi:hypothetical protein DFS34DRAFT_639825 [Phlyctochytrium arcticum]|nr:hypothetical protein DFS34DRAFT_639825 [Phlyctochytrium arcticum]
MIYGDMWKGYVTPWLKELGYDHETVNHSQHFVDPDSGVHTQNIESNWRAGKGRMPRNGTSKPREGYGGVDVSGIALDGSFFLSQTPC